MALRFSPLGGDWGLIRSQDSRPIFPYDSFISAEVHNSGQVISHPVERGGFADYNKVEAPCEVRVILAVMDGNEDRIRVALDRLHDLCKGVETFSLITPHREIPNLALQNYDESYNREDGLGCLVVVLQCREVREVDWKRGSGAVPVSRRTQTMRR